MSSTIQRALKDKQHPYIQVARTLALDPETSIALKGFLLHCLAMPDDWKYIIKNLAKALNVTDESIYKLIKEGIKTGYITRQEFKSKGKFNSVEYFIHEDKIQIILPLPEKPDTEKPHAEKPELTKEITYSVPKGTSYVLKKENNQEAAGAAESDLIFYGKYVKISQQDYELLCEEFTKVLVDQIIVEMNDYVPNMPRKPYRDYAAALRSWMRNRKTEPKSFISSEENKSYAIECSKKYYATGASWDIQETKVRIDGGGSITWCEEFRYDIKEFKIKLDRFLKDKYFRPR